MQTNRHRKPSPTRAIAARTAVAAGVAAAAVLVSGGAASASTDTVVGPAAVPAGEQAPLADPPCTDTPLDAIVGPLTGADCNTNPDPPVEGGNPDDDGGTPPPPPAG